MKSFNNNFWLKPTTVSVAKTQFSTIFTGCLQVASQSLYQLTVELSGIPAGIYIVSLYSGNKHIESRQLSVTH